MRGPGEISRIGAAGKGHENGIECGEFLEKGTLLLKRGVSRLLGQDRCGH
jgi:hypothetical protein